MPGLRWIGVVTLVVAASAGCEVRDDACPDEPRDGTLCFDEQMTCTYGGGGACLFDWECTCDGGRWDCQRNACQPDVPDAYADVPTLDVAKDVAPPDAWQDVPPPADVDFDVPPDTFDGCPAEAPLGTAASCGSGNQRCEYGQECCCGQCAPSLVCQCGGGQWGCYNTDFCFRPGCPDVADVFEAVEPADTVDAPDVPPVEPGRCRTGADCDNRWGAFCLSPDAPQTCGICFRPEDTCQTDADCAGTPAAPVCAPSRAPCLCETGVRECAPRCDAAGTTQACDPVTQQCDGSGLCVPRACQGSADCAVNFRCAVAAGAGTCQRLSCGWDPDCDDGWCVNGACHFEPGTCDFPKP